MTFHSNGAVKALTMRTRSLPCFLEIYQMFYLNVVKIVPSDQDLFTYLTPIAIAHWVCCDGYWGGSGVVLCTDSFSLLSVEHGTKGLVRARLIRVQLLILMIPVMSPLRRN